MLKSKPEKNFDVEQNVKKYIEAREGMDGRFLIEILKEFLEPNSTVLEIGMGGGNDLDILNETFQTTGSDNSQIFLEIYKQENSHADLILLDAVPLETDRKFDCIYSNKVLHHLSKPNLRKSIKKQSQLLKQNGIIFHTFWNGNKKDEFQDLHFIQYKIDELKILFEFNFELLKIGFYEEMLKDDSIYVILRKI
jgi:SAM-dependent methyltransferase